MKALARHLAQAFADPRTKPTKEQLRNALWDVENALSDFPQDAREALFDLDLDLEDIHRLMVEIYYAETFDYVAYLPDSESGDDDALAMALERIAADVESHEPTNLAALEPNPSDQRESEVEQLIEHIRTTTFMGERGYFVNHRGGYIKDIASRFEGQRSVTHLLKKYGTEIAHALGFSGMTYSKAQYHASDSGDFGRYGHARAGREKASIRFF